MMTVMATGAVTSATAACHQLASWPQTTLLAWRRTSWQMVGCLHACIPAVCLLPACVLMPAAASQPACLPAACMPHGILRPVTERAALRTCRVVSSAWVCCLPQPKPGAVHTMLPHISCHARILHPPPHPHLAPRPHPTPAGVQLGQGQGVDDVLRRLQESLNPVERYAVRFLEESRPVDIETAAAQAVEAIKQEEWQLDAIEKR
jgi:hypothetical protein